MKEIIKNSLSFIRNNPSVISSLVLIVAVTGIIFFNSYYILTKAQENNDVILQKKAVLVEDVLHIFISDLFANKDFVQDKLEQIKAKDSEIKEISILIPTEEGGSFQVAASTDKENVNKKTANEIYGLAWSDEQRGIAYLNNDGSSRFWDVAKVIMDGDKKIGLTVLKLSLKNQDDFIDEKIKNVYWVSIVSAFIVLFLMLNHIRMFKYVIKAVKLEEVDKMKDEFISMASHELKTPMTALLGYVDLLKDTTKKRKPEEVKDELHYLDNMEISINRLEQLVEDILEVSRIEQNRLPIKSERMNINLLLDKVIEDMKLTADQKELQLVYIKNNLMEVSADVDRVQQILINLIGNAIKYTLKGKVEIITKEDSKFVYITVADTGLGISPDGMKNLFSKFFRVKTNETLKISGTGLGLWISKQLAMKMGGDIVVESIEGVGSHFTLKLKKA